jgi:hypothetical protein
LSNPTLYEGGLDLNVTMQPPHAESSPAQPWRGMSLVSLLRSSAAVKPGGPAFAETGDPASRLDAGNAVLDYRAVGLAMDGLRLRLTGLGVAAGDTVAIVMPNRAEAMVAILGLLEAGIRPLLLPASVAPDVLWVALAATDACGLLVCGDGPGAELSAGLVLAARTQRSLRFIAAFGERAPPGSVPLSGLSELQTLGQVADPSERQSTARTSILTVELLDGIRPIAHSQEALIAGALHIGLTAGIVAGDPILTTLPAATQAGLLTGLTTALVTGSPLHLLPIFSGDALAWALSSIGACHLIAPGLLEQPLAAERLLGSDRLCATLLLHRAPADLGQPTTPAGAASPVVDILALGERAALAAARDSRGRPTLAAGAFGLGELPGVDPVATLEVDALGTPIVRGPAIGRPPLDGAQAPQRVDGLALSLRDDGTIMGAALSGAYDSLAAPDPQPRQEASSGL